MNIYKDNALFPYLSGEMLRGSKWIMTIAGVDHMEVTSERGKQSKIAIRLVETEKPLLLNKVNAKMLIKLYGPETDDWIGCRITLRAERIKAFGEEHQAIRVGPPPKNELGKRQKIDKSPATNAQPPADADQLDQGDGAPADQVDKVMT